MTEQPLAAARAIGAESVLVLGGARAILLQLANPAVGRGVAGHSDFAHRALGRLRTTLDYVYLVTYGDAEERAQAARIVNRAHGPVRGPGYSAFDPALQLWVTATLYETAISVHELVYGPLPAERADAVYRDYAVLGTALQMPAEAWPPSRAYFDAYWRAELQNATTDAAVRRVARELLFTAELPWWLRPARPAVRLITAGLLPEPIRPLFGIRWTERSERVFRMWISTLRIVYPRLPRALRHAPQRAALRRARAALRYPERRTDEGGHDATRG